MGSKPESALTTPWDSPPEPGEAIEVAEGVLWARLPLPMALDHVNTYFLREGSGWGMVDTGLGTRLTQDILEVLRKGPLRGDPISRLLCTHHHPDHIGLAGNLQRQGTELLMSRTAWLFGRMLTLDVQEVPTPETLEFWRINGMAQSVFQKRQSERPFNFADCVAPLPLGFTHLEPNTQITFGDRVWDIAFGQGHAPDHVVLYEKGGDDLVLAGDQLLPSISPNIGVYATEPEADPLGEWLSACEALAPRARPEQLVLPGHKLPYRGLPFRMRQLAENHHSALNRLIAHLATPRVGGDCFIPLFKRTVTSETYGLAFAETIAHLNHLFRQGKITRSLSDDGVYLWQIRNS